MSWHGMAMSLPAFLHPCIVCWGALCACIEQRTSVTPEVYFPSLAHNQRKNRYHRILVWLVSEMFVGHGLRNMAWLSVLEKHGTILPLLDMAWHGVDCMSWHFVLVSWLRFCPCCGCCHASIVTWMLAIHAFSWVMLSWFHQHVCVCVHVIPWIEVGSKVFPMEFCANFAFRDWQLVANQRELQPKVLEAWQGPIGHQLQL